MNRELIEKAIAALLNGDAKTAYEILHRALAASPSETAPGPDALNLLEAMAQAQTNPERRHVLLQAADILKALAEPFILATPARPPAEGARPPQIERPYFKERVTATCGDGIPAEIEYLTESGEVVGFWAYGYWDPKYPYQGEQRPVPAPAAPANPFALSPSEIGDRAGLTAAEVQARVDPAPPAVEEPRREPFPMPTPCGAKHAVPVVCCLEAGHDGPHATTTFAPTVYWQPAQPKET